MQTITELAPNQLAVIDWITRGLSVEDAAKEVQLSWAAIMEWRRSSPAFRLAFEEALECRAMLIRERAHLLIFDALDVLQAVLKDPKASPSIRLRASLAIVKMSAPAVAGQRKTENMHNSAQGQPTRLPVHPGRNSICPCGSGAKFKRCCANSATSAVAAGASADSQAVAA